jgi:hypothetical protein
VYNIIFSAAKPIGALLFGIAFWSLSRTIPNDAVKNYMIISAYGVTLLFTTNQPLGLIFTPYPPFGLATICYIGLASYLLVVGIYSSAVSVANDSLLRRSIRKSVTQKANLLDKIGTAQMQHQIETIVLESTRALSSRIEDKSGVEPSLGEEELRDYISKVIEEVKSDKNRGE